MLLLLPTPSLFTSFPDVWKLCSQTLPRKMTRCLQKRGSSSDGAGFDKSILPVAARMAFFRSRVSESQGLPG